MSRSRFTKRSFLQIAATAPFWLTSMVIAKDKSSRVPNEQGIGGTGQSLRGGDEDQGIGGTGIFGTIQRFGSIYVNDRHITYSEDTPVFMDGVRAEISSMKIGHVVRVVLDETGQEAAARLINITSEVIGRVETVRVDRIVVLSQVIELSKGITKPPLRKGMTVAVHGIRKTDGIIVASRIDARKSGTKAMLRGVAEQDGGRMKVGNLLFARPPYSLFGKRVVLDLLYKDDGLNLQRAVREDLVPGLQAGTVNVETFREYSDTHIRLGIGAMRRGGSAPITSRGSVYLDVTVSSGGLDAGRGANDDAGRKQSQPVSPSDHPGTGPRNDMEPGR